MIVVCLFVALLLFLSVNQNSCQEKVDFSCQNGKWYDTSDSKDLYELYPVNRFSHDIVQSKIDQNNGIIEGLCPAESFYFNCHYLGANERIERLMKRRWKSDNKNCLEYHPVEFLKLVKNRKILLLGETQMEQLWSGFVCSMYKRTTIDLEIEWRQKDYRLPVCPFGDGKHCSFTDATAYSPSYNVTIILKEFNYHVWNSFNELNKDEETYLESMIRQNSLSKSDLVFVMGGIHEDRLVLNEYQNMLKTEIIDKYNFEKDPQIIVTELTPDHYTGMTYTNGYFYTPEGAPWCQDYFCNNSESTCLMELTDYRKSKIENKFASQVPILRLTKPLYSEFDSHIAADSTLGMLDPADCENWCSGSGIFEFIHTAIYNKIRELVSIPFKPEKKVNVDKETKYDSEIVAFYNIYAAGSNYEAIIDEQINMMNSSGLLQRLEKVYYATSGSEGETFTIAGEKFEKLQFNGISGSEEITLNLLHNYCESKPSSKVLYFHDKGSFHNNEGNRLFRRILNCFTLNTNCIETLDNHDICGWRFSPIPHPHFSGNFWWARCDYVNKLVHPLSWQTNTTFQELTSTLNECINPAGRYFAEV